MHISMHFNDIQSNLHNNSTPILTYPLFIPSRIFFRIITIPISLTIFHYLLHSPLPNIHLFGFFRDVQSSVMNGVSVFGNKFIMFSLSRLNEETAASALPQKQQSSMIIQQLQAEIKHLHQAIALKDQTLEEIRKLVNDSLSQKTAFSSFDIVTKSLGDAKINRQEPGIVRSIIAQIDQSIEYSFSAAREQFSKLLRYYDSAIEVVNSQYHQAKDQFPLIQDSIKIVQIPVEVVMYVQVIKYIEVPIAKVQEVEVYSIMPVQIETVVEKQVLHEVPVEIILVEDETEQGEMIMLNSVIPEQGNQAKEEESLYVELEVQIDPQQLEIGERVFEVQKIIEKVQVQKIVYVDRPIQIIKTVQRIVQVPVQVIMEKLIEIEIIIQRNNETVIKTSKEIFVDNNIIFQIPVKVEVQHATRENQDVHHINNEEKDGFLLHADNNNEKIDESNHNYIQITDIEVVIQNKEQSADTQLHTQPISQRIVYVPVEVIKVVQVPLLKIVEIPVELMTSQVIEVPVEMQIEPLIYEIPIDVAGPVYILQIPLEMQEPPIVIEVPVEMNMIDQERASTPLNRKAVSGQAINEQIDSPAVHFSLKKREKAWPQKLKEEVVVIPIDQNLNEIQIDAKSHSSCSQIVVEIPYQLQSVKSVCDAEIQTDEIIREQQLKMVKCNSDQQIYDALTLLECAQKPKEQDPPKVHIIQIPTELQMDYSEEVRKMLELKYRERINDLHNQYSTEIANLHQMLQNLQRIIIEEQQVAQHLRDQLEHKALQEQKLNSNIIKLQQRVREREETVTSHEQLKKVCNQLQSKYNQLLNEPPTLYEMVVQMVVKIDRETVSVQTDDLTLPNDISVIEVPIEIQVVEKISDSSLRRSEEDEVKSSSTTNNKYFKGYTEQELQQKLKAMMVRPQFMDHQTQTEKQLTIDDLVDFQLRTENQLNITEMFDNTQIINKNYKIYAQNEQSMREEHLISGIQSIEQYENIIDFKIYEYAVEVYPEPVIYEVPVDVKVFKELSISEVQTDDVYSQIVVQEKIFQVPIELHVKKWTIDAQIQTEKEVIVELSGVFSKKNETVTTKVYEYNMIEKDVYNSRAQLLYASSTHESKLIEIPIELNIQVQKETISIDIQTRQTWNQVDKSGKNQQSKLRITPVLQEKLIAKQQTCEIALGNPYETHNVIRPESACFPIPEHRIQELASNTDIFDNEMIVLQQNNGNDSRVVVHVQDNNELHFDQIGQLREAVGKGSEIKQNYIEIYQQNHNAEVERYKSLYQQLQQENFELKEELEQAQNKYQQEIKRLQLHKLELQRNLSNYQTIVQQENNKYTQLSVLKSKEQQKLEKLEEQYEKLKNYNANLEASSNKEIDRLQTIINDKIEQIKEVKLQQHQTKQMYQAQITALRTKVVERDENIQSLEQQNQKRLTKIQQLIQYQDELRKAVAYAKQNSENNTVALYQQQFQRIKDDFEEKKRQLKGQVITLNEDMQSLKAELQAETQRNRLLTEQIRYIQNKFEEVKGQYTVLRSVKSELESNYVQNLKEFNAQLQQCRELIAQKDKIIHQLQTNSERTIESPVKLTEANPEAHEGQPVRMEYLSRKVSREADDPRFVTAYVHKLQKLLVRYQRIMAGNESTIQQLQEKVCEYLRDALQKEQEAENLYSKLVEYQCAMNNILVEKITLQIQNKRMTKAVELSQRKVLILGNKLIEAMGRRAPHDSEDSDYYYQ